MEKSIADIGEIKIHGRAAGKEPLTLFFTASGFECNVSGTELWVEVESTYDTYEPWFSYTVNGDWVGRQMLPKGKYWVPLFRGMSADKVKNVRFFKDVQAMSGDGNSFIHIHALRYDGAFYPVEDKKLKIEFIGDSITSGEGLFGAQKDEDFVPMFFSALKGYPYLVANQLDADYRVFSQSGWGVHSAWDNNPNCAIPPYYEEICSLLPGEKIESLGGKEKYKFQEWKADFVVVNLGTNDASSFVQPPWVDELTKSSYKMRMNEDGSYCEEDLLTFENDVFDFLNKIRKCNPQAYIIWCYGMIGLDLSTSIEAAISRFQAEVSDKRISFVKLNEANEKTMGSRNHPGYLCHKEAADTLVSFIEEVTKQGQ